MDSNLLMSGKVQATPPTPLDGDVIPLSMTSSGRTRVDTTGTVSISGTPAVTVSGTPNVTATISGTPTVSISGTPNVNATISGTPNVNATISGTPTVTVSGTVTTSGTPASGTGYALTTAANTNAASIKGSAGNLYEITAFNSTASTIYIRLYNRASAPTMGTDVPIVTIPVATNALANIQFGHLGKRFSIGLAIAVTGASGNTDATAVAAGALISATYL